MVNINKIKKKPKSTVLIHTCLSPPPPTLPLAQASWTGRVPKCETALMLDFRRIRFFTMSYVPRGGGGSKLENFMKQKSPKSTLLGDNTQRSITTKQTKPRPVASVAPHPIKGGGGVKLEKLWEFFFFSQNQLCWLTTYEGCRPPPSLPHTPRLYSG